MDPKFPPLPFYIDCLTNENVIKLYNESKRHFRAGSQRIIHRWVCSILKKHPEDIHSASLLKRIKSVVAKLRKLKTSRNYEQIDPFEKQIFRIPERFNVIPKIDNVQPKINALKKKISDLYVTLGNEKKKVRRKNIKIINLKKEMEFHKELVKTPKMKTTIMQTENAKPMISSKGTQCNLTRLDGQILHQEISYLQNEIISISNQEISDQTIPKLRERTRGNPYTNKIRECVLYCISKNVPMQNISDVIGSIVKIVNGHEIDNLPSVASIHNMSREAKAICNRQVEEAIGNSENITLMKDATSKQGRHFYGTKISGSEGEFTLGI